MTKQEKYTPTIGEQLQKIASHYDEEADTYQEGYSTPLCKAEDAAVIHHVSDVVKELCVGDFPTLEIISAGCGDGFDYHVIRSSLESLSTPHAAVRFNGYDISPKMIEDARKLSHREVDVLDEVSFDVADMHHMPVPSHTKDMLISLFGPFSYSLDPKALVHEFVRVLKPGANAIVMPYSARLGIGYATGFTTAPVSSRFENGSSGHVTHGYTVAEAQALFSSYFQSVDVVGINFFGNIVEELSEKLESPLPDPNDTYAQLLATDKLYNKILPAHFARHMMVIARGCLPEVENI